MEAESTFLITASVVLQLSSGSYSVLHDGFVLHEPAVDCRREAPVINVGGDLFVTLRRICSQVSNDIAAYLWLPRCLSPDQRLSVILFLLRKKGSLDCIVSCQLSLSIQYCSREVLFQQPRPLQPSPLPFA
jgi:hypothetical protein